MTILAYRPELAIALVDDSYPSSLSPDARTELERIFEQIAKLLTPLTQVRSLAAAENLVRKAEQEYDALSRRCAELRSSAGSPEPPAGYTDGIVEMIRESGMVSEDVKEQLLGVLESSSAYTDWFRRNYAKWVEEDAQPTFEAVVQQVYEHVRRAGIALSAVLLTLAGRSDSAPEAIPALAELADHYWTEVEDVFLGLAEYGEDGGTVPLSEVRAELGL